MSDARAWDVRAADAVAGFTSTRSKGPDAMFGGPGGPTHIVRAHGATIETADGRSLLDWTMALGAVGLGYGHPHVVEAAARAVADGAVGPLPPVLEVTVAERLCAGYPGAEQARFFKTGAEGVAAAVRVARAATGRDGVVSCGYHGWLDGPTVGAGVPADVAAHWRAVPFDDPTALDAAVDASAPAAIVLEPVVVQEPSRDWLETARAAADRCGAVLVFDEVKTGFRLARGGAAQRYGVHPDLAVLGKAMANGFPLAALVGRADLMARLRQTWVSSTLATEWVALAAANAVLDVWEREDVAAHIERIGTRVIAGIAPACARAGVPVAGIPAMFFLRFDDHDRERRFLLGMVERGVLVKRGAYDFPSLAHTDADADRTVAAVERALQGSA